MSRARENSVRHIQGYLKVLAGVAFTVGITRVFLGTGATPTVRWDVLPGFITLLVVLLPFCHGAARHLDRTYIEQPVAVRPGALVADSGLLFVEGIAMVVLAGLLLTPRWFAWVLAGLLVLDSLWGFLAHLSFTADIPRKPETRWAALNLVTAVILVFLLVFAGPRLDLRDVPAQLAVLGVTSLRTAADYWVCWPVYFPPA